MQQKVIASRDLLSLDGQRYTAKLCAPEQTANDDWSCAVFIEGDDDAPMQVYGVDALQALSLGLVTLNAKIRFLKARNPANHTWDDEGYDCAREGGYDCENDYDCDSDYDCGDDCDCEDDGRCDCGDTCDRDDGCNGDCDGGCDGKCGNKP